MFERSIGQERDRRWYTLCKNHQREAVGTDAEDALKEIESLKVSDQKVVLREPNRKLAVPLHDPEAFFDDWRDRKVDEAYDPAG